MLGHRLRRWSNIRQTLVKCVVLEYSAQYGSGSEHVSSQTTNAGLMLVQRRRRWASISPELTICTSTVTIRLCFYVIHNAVSLYCTYFIKMYYYWCKYYYWIKVTNFFLCSNIILPVLEYKCFAFFLRYFLFANARSCTCFRTLCKCIFKYKCMHVYVQGYGKTFLFVNINLMK